MVLGRCHLAPTWASVWDPEVLRVGGEVGLDASESSDNLDFRTREVQLFWGKRFLGGDPYRLSGGRVREEYDQPGKDGFSASLGSRSWQA